MPSSRDQQTTRTRIDAAWLAGLYEGEGCLVRKQDRRDGTVSWELSITCTDQDVIARAYRVAGVGTMHFVRRQREHWQDKHRWRVGSRDEIAWVCGLILPHLGERRRTQVEAFLSWFCAPR